MKIPKLFFLNSFGLGSFCLISLGVTGFHSSKAYAYIPPSQFIVKTWVKKHSDSKALKIRSTITALEDGKPGHLSFRETAIYNFEALTMKSLATDQNDQILYSTEKNLRSLSPASKLLISTNSQEVTEALKEKGILIRTPEELLQLRTETAKLKSENESMRRWNRSFAWVIGSAADSIETQGRLNPQVWFEKDTFLPLRLVYSASGESERLDFQFEDFHYFRDFPYPRNYRVSKKGKEMGLQAQVIDLTPVPGGTKHSGSATKQVGFTAAGESASGALKDLIQFYYDFVR